MEFWPVKVCAGSGHLNIDQLASLLARVGEQQGNFLAADLLKLVGAHVPLAQCTLFAYPQNRSPQIISFADRTRLPQLSRISNNYAQRFYSMDGNRLAMDESVSVASAERILLQRQSIDDIVHRDYRRICYEQPQISERLALLTHCLGDRWLSLNFYRRRDHGRFTPGEITFIEQVAPLIMQLVRLHYRAYVEANEMPRVLAERVTALYPDLTRRDQDLLKLMLGGGDIEAISLNMGIQPSSAATYVKRLYRKLGIGSQRELLALATEPRWVTTH